MSSDPEPEPKFYRAEFYIKPVRPDENNPRYEGISYGGNKDYDTGAATPYFPREVADQVVSDLSNRGWDIIFDPETDSYTFVSQKTGTIRVFKGEDIDIPNFEWEAPETNVHVYPIGHGVVGWMEVVKSWEYVTRAICPYCGYESEGGNQCPECGFEVNF